MKRIFIDGTGGQKWIGGLYYKKNIIFSLLKNPNISKNIQIIVATEKENEKIFSVFSDAIEIKILQYNSEKMRKLKLLLLAISSKAQFIFPSFGNIFQYFGIIGINWIPDFQHNKLPEFFSEEEIKIRNNAYKKIAKKHTPLVLSSYDSLNDFKAFYSESRKNVFIIPFVSFIEVEIKSLTEKEYNKILYKYDLLGRHYACVMNQFWKHKNHIIVFKAIQEYFRKNPNSQFVFVFTGKMEDYRNPDYIKSLKEIMQDSLVIHHIKMLGFIDRKEQIAIMKSSEFIIQPSLFEGWGTVLEDSKVLDKTILLSNIPIHREQKNEKCILFNPYNSDDLAHIFDKECNKHHTDNVKIGLKDMHNRALKYSKGFEKILLGR